MVSYKLPFYSGNITRFLVMFIIMLLLALGFMVNNAVNTWLTEKRYTMISVAYAMQKRIDTYRFATWQIYENLATSATGTPASTLQETRLRPDVYYLEKTRRKTESLIFGSHDSSTLEMTQRISTYLDTLWGAENSTWSMYFLNGQDNSLILISTLPLKDMATRYKENAINSIVNVRRAEMLQQANMLDERESFSPLRRFAWQHDHYFTLRTTFNQPGHLATVVAFDMPVKDLIPLNMSLENFQLIQQTNAFNSDEDEKDDDMQNIHVALVKSNIEINAAIPGTPLLLVYHVPLSRLVFSTLHNLLWPLMANLLLLLTFAGLLLFRQQSQRPADAQSAELDMLRILNKEIVSSLPLGLLAYDFSSNRTIVSNKIAEHLLPHLNLQKIISISDQHQGVLQVTVNNEVYEIRHLRSMTYPNTQFFLIRDQDRELLVNKKLQQAQRLLDRNQLMRQQLLQNLGHALTTPLNSVITQLKALNETLSNGQLLDVLDDSQALSRLLDDIVLLNQLESHDWTPQVSAFSMQSVLDELAGEILPFIHRKGLRFLINSRRNTDEIRFGDPQAIAKVLSSLLHYSLTTTQCGRISLDVDAPAEHPDRLMIQITDTGSGLTKDEVANTDFPWLGETAGDRFGRASGLTFFLCRQLCKHLGGQLTILAKPNIGTRYSIQLPVPLENRQPEDEKLLDGITLLTDITAADMYSIIHRHFTHWGAKCITPDEHFTRQDYDILVTDIPEKLNDWALLITDNEPGLFLINDRQYRVNINIISALQTALLQIIEKQLAQESSHNEDTLFAPGYFQLFVKTVPDDIKKLYTEQVENDYQSLAQTAHRLKGVFAMLNMIAGKQLCEALEKHIKASDNTNIKNTISDIDNYVNELLQQGNLLT